MAPGFGCNTSKWVCLACPKNNLDGGTYGNGFLRSSTVEEEEVAKDELCTFVTGCLKSPQIPALHLWHNGCCAAYKLLQFHHSFLFHSFQLISYLLPQSERTLCTSSSTIVHQSIHMAHFQMFCTLVACPLISLRMSLSVHLCRRYLFKRVAVYWSTIKWSRFNQVALSKSSPQKEY